MKLFNCLYTNTYRTCRRRGREVGNKGQGAQILASPLLLATHDFWLPRYNSSLYIFRPSDMPARKRTMTTSPRLLLSEDSNVINLGNSLHFKRLAERLCDKFDFRTVVARRTKNSFISQENIDLKSSKGFL